MQEGLISAFIFPYGVRTSLYIHQQPQRVIWDTSERCAHDQHKSDFCVCVCDAALFLFQSSSIEPLNSSLSMQKII